MTTKQSERALPKSLHTVSVICNLAAHIRATRVVETSIQQDIDYALRILGLSDLRDSHGIVTQCVTQLAYTRSGRAKPRMMKNEAIREENDRAMAEYRAEVARIKAKRPVEPGRDPFSPDFRGSDFS